MILSTTGEKKLVDQRLEEEAGQLADLRLEVSRLNTLLADREIEVKFFHQLSFFINYARRQRDPGETFSSTILFHKHYFFIDYTLSSTMLADREVEVKPFHRLYFFINIIFSLTTLFLSYPFSLTIFIHRLYFFID